MRLTWRTWWRWSQRARRSSPPVVCERHEPLWPNSHPFEDILSAGCAAILCTGGLDVIRNEAWPFYRKKSGVRLGWELEEPQGPKGPAPPNHLVSGLPE